MVWVRIGKLFIILVFIMSWAGCDLAETIGNASKEKEGIEQESGEEDSSDDGSGSNGNTNTSSQSDITPVDQTLAAALDKMYILDSSLKNDPTNTAYLSEATTSNTDSSAKKVILVHGWYVTDGLYTKLDEFGDLKTRILNKAWAKFIQSSDFGTLVDKGIQFYAYDYLTSDAVDTNGQRFRNQMDHLFGNETGTVVILAVSMGAVVSRFALYENDTPAYLLKIVSLGGPFHGTPWASPEYQKDMGGLGDIAGFLTDTPGGYDLRWDNFDDSLSGAENAKLTAINAKTDRDNLIFSYYGSIGAGTDLLEVASDSGKSIYAACLILNIDYWPSDCLVPKSSATLGGSLDSQDVGDYDHIDLRNNAGIRSIFTAKILELFGY